MRVKVRIQQLVLLLLASGLFALGWSTFLIDQARPLQAQDLPTVTPTPDLRLINEIFEPRAGDAIAGFVTIRGTALVENFGRFDLHIAEWGSEDWHWLTSSREIIRNGVLYQLDTTAYPDGIYELRLRALRTDGNYVETITRNLEIRNANPPTPTPIINELGTPLAQPTSPIVPTLTPTPTPEFISFIPNGQGIFEPRTGGIMRGRFAVIGTVNGFPRNPFARYELAISPAGFKAWEQLYSSTEQIWQNPIYQLDTTRWKDGLYDLRLRIVYRDSNYDEFEVRDVYIANYTAVYIPTPSPTPILGGIYSPPSNANVSGLVTFIGAADTTNLEHWELAWRNSGTTEWNLLVNSTERVEAGRTLATLDLSQLPVGAYDFRLRIVEQDGRRLDYFVSQLRVLRQPPPVTPTSTPFG